MAENLVAAPLSTAMAPELHQELDEMERAMLALGAPVELPVIHRFTPGLYAREIFMPAGTLLTSRIHNTDHPYVVISGAARVYIPGVGVQRLEAGHVGITQAGTRRLLYIEEDCRWITFHPLVEGESAEEDLPAIEARIIERRELNAGRSAFEEYSTLLAEAKEAGLLPGEEGAEPCPG